VALIGAVARGLAVAALAGASVVLLTDWLVRRRTLQPFATWPRLVRRLSAPALQPLERGLVRAGRPPHAAPAWLLGVAVLGGLLLIAAADGAMRLAWRVQAASAGGVVGILALAVDLIFGALVAAIVVRVVASWFGAGEYNKLIRPCYLATNWLIRPIRRWLPPTGMLDLSPLVAYLVLLLGRSLLLGFLR